MNTADSTAPRLPENVPASGSNRLFPIFLKMEQLHVLLVGGGNVGHEKLAAILGNSPATAVTVVATYFSDALLDLAEKHPAVQLREQAYQPTDLVGHDLVIV